MQGGPNRLQIVVIDHLRQKFEHDSNVSLACISHLVAKCTIFAYGGEPL
jgi:hypothetical protein